MHFYMQKMLKTTFLSRNTQKYETKILYFCRRESPPNNILSSLVEPLGRRARLSEGKVQNWVWLLPWQSGTGQALRTRRDGSQWRQLPGQGGGAIIGQPQGQLRQHRPVGWGHLHGWGRKESHLWLPLRRKSLYPMRPSDELRGVKGGHFLDSEKNTFYKYKEGNGKTIPNDIY